jgi:flagellar biosynthetic protein FlhB
VSRTFSWQGAIELAKAVLKTVLLGGVLVAVLWDQAETFALLAAQPLPGALVDMVGLLRAAFVAVMLVLLLVVVIDVPFQLWQHAKQLRMTREEVRKEARETEGSPELRGRIRQLQRDMARRRMMAEVPRADVVVTNPTHYAVALRYQEGRMRAPEVVAKGAREVAERILETAREHSVPVLQAPPLARALHRHAELGEAVPAALYGAVAEVLAWVYQLRLARDYGVAAPARPEELEVPAELDPGPDADADAGALAPVAGRAMTGPA